MKRNTTYEFVGIERNFFKLIGSFLQITGFLGFTTFVLYALPLVSLYTGESFGIGTLATTPQGTEFVIMNKWHLTSNQFDAYMLSVIFSILFAKISVFGMMLGAKIKEQGKISPTILFTP